MRAFATVLYRECPFTIAMLSQRLRLAAQLLANLLHHAWARFARLPWHRHSRLPFAATKETTDHNTALEGFVCDRILCRSAASILP